MLEDFRHIQTREIDTDLCIIGAGAVGVTLAQSFIGSGIRVCLVESGGFEPDEATQALYEGEDTGYRQLYDVGNSRIRLFGGTTHRWLGRCAPLTETDFETRPWLPYSGWPIGKAALDPYFPQAKLVCELGKDGFDLASFPQKHPERLPFDTSRIIPRVWHVGPAPHFGKKYRDELAHATNIDIYLYANLTELHTSHDASRVVSATLKSLDGREASVTARYFVLACGGIENARILLLSNRIAPNGLGNDYDMVGRFYSDHLRCEKAAFVDVKDNRLLNFMVGDFHKGGINYEPMLTPSRIVQEHYKTLNWAVEFKTLPATGEWASSLYSVRNDLRSGKWPVDFGRHIWTVVSNLKSTGKGIYQHLTMRPLSILARCEIAPDPDSRILLTEERDALGQNKVRRHLRVTLREKHTLRSAVCLIGEELERMGVGRVRPADWLMADNDEWPSPNHQFGGVHHTGTTRMATDPKQGVVDGNCRVHGIENLYIGGSSVFPTAGYAHPTLNIVAMALRLADHIKEQFRISSVVNR